MIVKLLTEHHLEFLSLKGGCEARPSLHLSKCQIVGNLVPRLNLIQMFYRLNIKLKRVFMKHCAPNYVHF